MKPFFKIFGAVIIIAVLVLLGYYVFKAPNAAQAPAAPAAPAAPTQSNTPTTPNLSSNETFTDSNYGVTYQYPIDMAPTSSANGTTGTIISGLTLDKSFEPNTNFQGATLTVGESSAASSVSQCLLPQNGETAAGTLSINGATFSIFTFTDAGAGNFYDTTSYRTVHNSKCFLVEYAIHTTNIGNYDPSQGISAYDRVPVVSKLESVVESFAFTK